MIFDIGGFIRYAGMFTLIQTDLFTMELDYPT